MKIGRRKAFLASLSLTVLILAVFGCAPRSAEPSSNQEEEPQNVIEWTMNSDCAGCHLNEVASSTNSALPYSIHAVEVAGCTECHINDEGTLLKAHKDYMEKEVPTKLLATKISSDTCLSTCHVQEELIAITEDFTRLRDPYGTVVNPHDMPQTERHESLITCASCHKLHVAGESFDTTRFLCISCHHSGVFQCYTCHD